MGKIVWSEVFPNNASVAIFVGYMALFVGQGILVTWSQDTSGVKGYAYSTVTVVLLTEVLKLVVSVLLYQRENALATLVPGIVRDRAVLFLYFVPSVLYCFYNNLAFVNLNAFDPTTYYLLLQFRVVITGVLFQMIFKKSLSRMQWLSLLLLTAGCMIKQLDFSTIDPSSDAIHPTDPSTSILKISPHIISILIQAVCSCLAGVYNEYLLKNDGAHVNIYVQNVFMYLDSIVCNVIVLAATGELATAFTAESLASIWRVDVMLIIFTNAAIGIVTSFFLKYMNSILKTFASALELVFTAVLCRILFAMPIYLNTVLSIGVVSLAIYMYSQNPVVSSARSGETKKRMGDTKHLLSDEAEDV